jgi:hypothetical protein
MLALIETTFILRDQSKVSLEISGRKPGRVLRKFICEHTQENQERIRRLYMQCKERYDTAEVLEKRPYSNITNREVGWDWITTGESLEHASRYYSIPQSHEEEMKIRRRRLSGLKGALTRNINRAKALRAAYLQTLFPEHYKSDPKYIAFIRRIGLNRKNYNQERKNQRFLENHNKCETLKEAS